MLIVGMRPLSGNYTARIMAHNIGQASDQSAADYRIPKGLKLQDEASRAFQIATALWHQFEPKLQRDDLEYVQYSASFDRKICLKLALPRDDQPGPTGC